MPFAASGATGLRFAYYDSTGAVTAVRTSVSKIDVTLRAQSESAVRSPGFNTGRYVDSLVVSVGLRNRF
jgi:hypothetical protein